MKWIWQKEAEIVAYCRPYVLQSKTPLAYVGAFGVGFGGGSILADFFLGPRSLIGLSQMFFSWLTNMSQYMMVFHAVHGEILATVAAAIVGVIAITFSLAIFSIQYAAEKGTAQILREYRDDKMYRRSFILLCLFSLLLFIFAVMPPLTYFTLMSYVIAFLFLIATFFLLWRIFIHTIELVNPLDRIQKLYSGVVKYFSQPSDNIDKAIETKQIDIDDDKLDDQGKKDFLTTGVFNNAPNILNPVRSALSQIFDIIREYIPRRKYDVTFQGYTAIAYAVGQYFKARKKSIESAGIFGSRTDSFLTDVYEQLSALWRISIGARDLTSARQNLRCFQAVAAQAAKYPSLIDRDANPTMNMALGYMKMNVQEGVRVGMDDLGLDGIRILRDVEGIVPAALYFTTVSIVTDIYDVTLTGVVPRKSYIVEEGTSALVRIYHRHVKPYAADPFMLRRTIFDKLKTISRLYLATGPDISVDCSGLSAVFSILNPDSIPNKFALSVPEITPDNFSRNALEDLVWFYNDIGEKAASAESFLMHFIIQAINQMISVTLDVFSKKEDKAAYEKILLDQFMWLASIYWRMYDKMPENYKRNYIETNGIDNLVALALRAIQYGFTRYAASLVTQIVSVISVGIKKKSDEFTVPRLFEHLIKVGIVARAKGLDEMANSIIDEVEKLNTQFLKQAQPKVPKDYFERNYKESLSHEMWNIYREFQRDVGIVAFDSDFFFNEMVGEKQIKLYLNEIERRVYNREVENAHRSFGF